MGNCIETCRDSQEVKREQEQQVEEEKTSGFAKENGSMRIKVVLTKEELEWLLFQLKNKGEKKLEDVLGEIERGRERVAAGWKPSLESIMESPEVLEMDK